jgi:hypothetical protein
MSRKRISHSARLKGPPPEQIRRRNLVIGILVVAAVALVATIAVGMNREANQVANNSPKLTEDRWRRNRPDGGCVQAHRRPEYGCQSAAGCAGLAPG